MINFLQLANRQGAAAQAAEPGFVPQERTDAADFEELVDSQYRRVYSLIYRMVRNETDAADLTQETFVRVYRALPRLREAGARSAWVRRIATNLCLDYLRRRNSSPPVASLDARPSEDSDTMLSWDIADPTSEPDRIISAKERSTVLHKAIDSLPPDYRLVILMHHVEELRVEDIADTLGVPSGTIKSRLSRARRELHRKLSPYFDANLANGGR